jgi:hypothetical protein
MLKFTRRGMAGLAAGAVLALAGCNTPARRFRERLTLFVDTPTGLVTASSVTEHETRFQDGWLGGLAGHAGILGTRGEATIVDLGDRGLMFALLAKDNMRKGSGGPGGYEYNVFAELYAEARERDAPNSDKALADFIDTLNRLKPEGDLPVSHIGLLVRFRDLNDPSTVERVDPGDLAASFGAGVTMKGATIEITDAPLTTGIEKRLPWLQGGNTYSGRVIAPRSGSQGPNVESWQVPDLTDADFWRYMT